MSDNFDNILKVIDVLSGMNIDPSQADTALVANNNDVDAAVMSLLSSGHGGDASGSGNGGSGGGAAAVASELSVPPRPPPMARLLSDEGRDLLKTALDEGLVAMYCEGRVSPLRLCTRALAHTCNSHTYKRTQNTRQPLPKTLALSAIFCSNQLPLPPTKRSIPLSTRNNNA